MGAAKHTSRWCVWTHLTWPEPQHLPARAGAGVFVPLDEDIYSVLSQLCPPRNILNLLRHEQRGRENV